MTIEKTVEAVAVATEAIAEATTVAPSFDYMSLTSMKDAIAKLSPATQALFTAESKSMKANASATAKAHLFIQECSVEGIVLDEIIETFDGKVKDLGMWPSEVNAKGETTFVGVVRAKSVCIAAKIHDRLYQILFVGKAVKDDDGVAITHTRKNGDIITANAKNTTPDHKYTLGIDNGKDNDRSIAEVARKEAKENAGSNPTQPNPAGDAAQAKLAIESIEGIERTFTTVWNHSKESLAVLEKHRPELSKLVDGAAFLQEFGDMLIEQENNLVAHSESLMMKMQNNTFSIKRKSA